MRTQFLSLSYTANWQTKFLYFFLLPLINLLLLILIDVQYTGKFNWYVPVASVAVDAATLSLTTMSELLVKDVNLGITVEMLSKNPYSFYYWSTKSIVSIILGLLLGIINLVLLFVFGVPHDLLIKCLLVLPLFCIFGTIIGFTSWCISWQMSNPYFCSNLFSSVLTLVSGVLVLVSKYPLWLKIISNAFPFYSLISFIRTGLMDIVFGTLVAVIWLIVGIVAYILQIKYVLRTRINN